VAELVESGIAPYAQVVKMHLGLEYAVPIEEIIRSPLSEDDFITQLELWNTYSSAFKLGQEIVDIALDHTGYAETIDHMPYPLPAEELLSRIDKAILLSQADNTYSPIKCDEDIIAKFMEKHNVGIIRTGFRFLDESKAFRPGSLLVVGARTSVGKTAFGINLATQCCKLYPTLFISMEMPLWDVYLKAIAVTNRIPFLALTTMEEGELKKENDTANAIWNNGLYVSDKTPLTEKALKTLIERAIKLYGVKVIVVDYLQLIASTGKQTHYDTVSSVSKMLKRLTLAHKCGIVALAQLNREAARDGEPCLHHLRTSGEVEQDADSILLLNRELGDRRLNFSLAKNRNGPTLGWTPLDFDLDTGKILEID
jgi:replicative DNA helicase